MTKKSRNLSKKSRINRKLVGKKSKIDGKLVENDENG